MQKTVQRIIKKYAKETNLPEAEIEKALKSQFKLVKKVAEESDRKDPNSFKTVQLIKFGKFYVTEKTKKAYIEKLNKKRDDKE
jgi:nucleoid DNA-binding protein